MRRISPSLARRIDRLARHAHAFHRFAHHPVCFRYAGEVVRLGAQRRVCRGCLAAGLGLLIGTGVGLRLPASPHTELLLLGLATLIGLTSLRLRIGKVVTRFLPAAFGSITLASSLHRASAGDRRALLTFIATLVIGACGLVAYRRRGPNRAACTSCPERLGPAPCSGLAPIVRRERAFQRLAQLWIDKEQRCGHSHKDLDTSPNVIGCKS